MRPARWLWLRNPATWYVVFGLGMLGLSLLAPYGTANRTTRAEQRADAITRDLLAAALSAGPELTDAEIPILLARFQALAARDDLFVADLEMVEPPWPGTLVSLRNDHYCFHVAVSPPDPEQEVGRGTLPSYEAMAWPRTQLGPAHSAYMHAENTVCAYTRNLAKGYTEQKPPHPGAGQRRPGGLYEWTKVYRGTDEQFWFAHLSR